MLHFKSSHQFFEKLKTKSCYKQSKFNMEKLWVLLNYASTSTQLHPPPPSLFQPPPSSLQHPQQYLNQNIPRNWAISPNLDQKIKSCPF